MLKVSRRLNYGLQLMIALASETEQASIPTATVSQQLGIPLPFLHQIAHTLMQSGLIKATPGPKGGLHIGRNPETISLWDIIEALEGKLSSPTSEPDENGEMNEAKMIACSTWETIGNNIFETLKGVKLSDLAIEKQTK